MVEELSFGVDTIIMGTMLATTMTFMVIMFWYGKVMPFIDMLAAKWRRRRAIRDGILVEYERAARARGNADPSTEEIE